MDLVTPKCRGLTHPLHVTNANTENIMVQLMKLHKTIYWNTIFLETNVELSMSCHDIYLLAGLEKNN